MKIGEGLQEKKRLQARLAKCYELSKQCYSYTTKEPDFDFNKLQDEINDLITKIKELKIRIQKTNLEVKVKYGEGEHTLQELIIDIADIRSILNYLNNLYDPDDVWRGLRYEEKEVKRQVPPDDIQKLISQYNKDKNKLDSLLQHTNWTIDLV